VTGGMRIKWIIPCRRQLWFNCLCVLHSWHLLAVQLA